MLVLVSKVTNSDSVSTFLWLVCVPVNFSSSAVGIKMDVKSLQELESINQLQRKWGRSMTK